GHTFGLNHYTVQDPERRAVVVGAVGDDSTLAPRFSPFVGPHDDGRDFAEFSRLQAYIGLAAQPNTDTQTALTLPHQPPPVVAAATATLLALSAPPTGRIDFAGARDAFQFLVTATGLYSLTQRAASGSGVDPVLTLWNGDGDFLAVGTAGIAGGTSTLSAPLVAGQTYFLVAGSGCDRLTSPQLPRALLGDYVVEVVRPKALVAAFDPAFATWYVRHSTAPGAPDVPPFVYGARDWIPLCGDWNG